MLPSNGCLMSLMQGKNLTELMPVSHVKIKWKQY
jgi:hypothetical protein